MLSRRWLRDKQGYRSNRVNPESQRAWGIVYSSVLAEWLVSADVPIKYCGDKGVPAIVVKRGNSY